MVGVTVSAAVLAVYVTGLAPTILWGDSADLPLRIIEDDSSGRLARDYRFYRYVGRLFLHIPIGDPAYRINLLSAVFSAIGVLLTYATVLVRTQSVAAAFVGAGALALSHSWWWMSEVSEVYTFSGAFLLASLLLWAVWMRRPRIPWLVGSCLVTGLAISAHASGVLLVACVVILLAARRMLSRGEALVAAAGVLVGTGFFALTMWNGLRSVGFAEIWSQFSVVSPLSEEGALVTAIKALALFLYQYPFLSLIAFYFGLRKLVRRLEPWDELMLLTLVTYGLWMSLARMPDAFNAYVFIYVLAAPAVGIGAAECLYRLDRFGLASKRAAAVASIVLVIVTPPVLYSVTPAILDRAGLDITGARQLPNRHNNWYFLFPPKRNDYGAHDFASSALDTSRPAGIILSDYTLWRPLVYVQRIEGKRVDVDVLPIEGFDDDDLLQFLARELQQRPVYLAATEPAQYYRLDKLLAQFSVDPEGSIFRLRKK